MLDKINQMKDMYALKKQADGLKKQMQAIKITLEEGDYTIVMTGDQEVESVMENGEMRDDLKKLFNKAVKKSQKEAAKKMRGQLGSLGIPGL